MYPNLGFAISKPGSRIYAPLNQEIESRISESQLQSLKPKNMCTSTKLHMGGKLACECTWDWTENKITIKRTLTIICW